VGGFELTESNANERTGSSETQKTRGREGRKQIKVGEEKKYGT